MALLSIQELESVSPIFRGRAGNAFAGWLLKALKIQKISDIYDSLASYSGPEFACEVNRAAGLNYTVNGLPREKAIEEMRRILPDGPFITVANHPIGSLDGTILIDLIGHVREDYKYMVNEILWRLEAMHQNLIKVNPNGSSIAAPTAQSISGVREAMEHIAGGHPLGLFPSGAVSDLKLGRRPLVPSAPELAPGSDSNGKGRIAKNCKEPMVRDREWQMSAVRLIKKMGVPVLPIRFLDGNSMFYYNLGLLDWRIRLLRLPSEMLNKAGKTIRLVTGPLITPEKIAEAANLQDLRDFLRASVYSLTGH